MIKVILVPLDGTDHSAAILHTALVVARRFDAHIKVVHVRGHTSEPYMFSSVPKAFRDEYLKMTNQEIDQVADRIKQQFNDFCAEAKIKKTRQVNTREVSASLHLLEGNSQSVLGHESRLADVVAMSRPVKHRLGGSSVGEMHEQLMLNSGRPVMIVPPDWDAKRVDHAAIGWNDSVEASRTVSMTLPWLRKMKKVTVLGSKKREAQAGELVAYLKSHGCKSDSYILSSRSSNVGKTMLKACNRVGAEFLVVGGFSHTRTRQRLFGGVTSHLLANTNVITVMAH